MARIAIQVLLLIGVVAGTAWPFVSIPEAQSRPATGRPAADRLAVKGVRGTVEVDHGAGFVTLRDGPLRLPARIRMGDEGALRLVRGAQVHLFDHGARAVVVGTDRIRRIVLESGRLRASHSRAQVWADGHAISGSGFGIWFDEGGFDVMALEPTQVEELDPMGAGTGRRFDRRQGQSQARIPPERLGIQLQTPNPLGFLRAEVGPMVRVRRIDARGSRWLDVDDGQFRTVLSEDSRLVAEDPVGRLAGLPGTGAPLGPEVGTLRQARTRLDPEAPWEQLLPAPAGDAVGGDSSPTEDSTAESPSTARVRADESRRDVRPSGSVGQGEALESRSRRPPRPRRRVSEASPARDVQQPPESLKVDWTQLGRPEGEVLDKSKPETAPPPPPPREPDQEDF